MKGKLFLILLVVFSNTLSAQDLSKIPDWPYKLKITLTPSIFYIEPGVGYTLRTSEKKFIELNAAGLVHAYNPNESGHGTNNQTWDGLGAVVRLGTYNIRYTKKGFLRYDGIRFSYKNVYFPMYSFPDGSEGLSLTPWYNQTESRNIFFMNVVFGRMVNMDEHFARRTFVSFGLAYASINTVRYGLSSDSYFSGTFAEPEKIHTEGFRFSIGLGYTFSYWVK